MLVFSLLLLLYLNLFASQVLSIVEPPSFNFTDLSIFDASFLEPSTQYAVISNNSQPKFTRKELIGNQRIFGLKGLKADIKMEICISPFREMNDGHISLCYFNSNMSQTMVMKKYCKSKTYFCGIQFHFDGEKQNVITITGSSDEGNPIIVDLGTQKCIQGTFITNETGSYFTTIEFEPRSMFACPLGAVLFNGYYHNYQTSVFLEEVGESCPLTIDLNLYEYTKITPTTTTSSSSSPTTTTMTTTPLQLPQVKTAEFMHHYWWIPVLAALILITLILIFCIVSCNLNNKAQETRNKLFRRILIRRHQRKKELKKMNMEERHNVKRADDAKETEDVLLSDTQRIVNEVFLEYEESSKMKDNGEKSRKSNDPLLKVTSLEPAARWKVPWKNEQQQQQNDIGGESVVENVAIDAVAFEAKEEPSDDDWLHLEKQTIDDGSTKESEMKKLSKERVMKPSKELAKKPSKEVVKKLSKEPMKKQPPSKEVIKKPSKEVIDFGSLE